MFDKLFVKKERALDYSELVPRNFRKEEVEIFFNDPAFQEKYREHYTTINAFINELSKDYKSIEIIALIERYVVNVDTNTMAKIIQVYLENPKDRKDIFKYINKMFNLDEDIYTQARKDEIDQNIVRLTRDRRETFHNITLMDLCNCLEYPEKEYFINILSIEGGFDAIKYLFEDTYNGSFKLLIRLFNTKGVDQIILNKDVLEKFPGDEYKELVFTLLKNNNIEIAKYIKMLIANHRYDLINYLMDNNLMGDIVDINPENKELDDITLIKSIEQLKEKRLVNNNY